MHVQTKDAMFVDSSIFVFLFEEYEHDVVDN